MKISRLAEAFLRYLNGLDALPWETDIEQDGGPGSGNWGHLGRPGKRGGSGKGGGSRYRSGSRETGFSRNQEAISTRNAGGEQIAGPSKTTAKQKRAVVPMSFTTSHNGIKGPRVPNRFWEESYQEAKKQAENAFGGTAWMHAPLIASEGALSDLMDSAEREDAYREKAENRAARRADHPRMSVLSKVPAAWLERLTDREMQLLDALEEDDTKYFDEEDEKLAAALTAKLYGADIDIEIPQETVSRLLGEAAGGEKPMPGQMSMFSGENVTPEQGEAWTWSTSMQPRRYEARRELQNARNDMTELDRSVIDAEKELKRFQKYVREQQRAYERDLKRADEAERNGNQELADQIRKQVERDRHNSEHYSHGEAYQAERAEERLTMLKKAQAASHEMYDAAKKRFLELAEQAGGRDYAARLDTAMENAFRTREQYEDAIEKGGTSDETLEKMKRESLEAWREFDRLMDQQGASGDPEKPARPEPKPKGETTSVSAQLGDLKKKAYEFLVMENESNKEADSLLNERDKVRKKVKAAVNSLINARERGASAAEIARLESRKKKLDAALAEAQAKCEAAVKKSEEARQQFADIQKKIALLKSGAGGSSAARQSDRPR